MKNEVFLMCYFCNFQLETLISKEIEYEKTTKDPIFVFNIIQTL